MATKLFLQVWGGVRPGLGHSPSCSCLPTIQRSARKKHHSAREYELVIRLGKSFAFGALLSIYISLCVYIYIHTCRIYRIIEVRIEGCTTSAIVSSCCDYHMHHPSLLVHKAKKQLHHPTSFNPSDCHSNTPPQLKQPQYQQCSSIKGKHTWWTVLQIAVTNLHVPLNSKRQNRDSTSLPKPCWQSTNLTQFHGHSLSCMTPPLVIWIQMLSSGLIKKQK